MPKVRPLFNPVIGQHVTCKVTKEALYSRAFVGTSTAYPECWFRPGDIGTIVEVFSPSVRYYVDEVSGKRRDTRHLVEFHRELAPPPGTTWQMPFTVWRVALSPDNVMPVEMPHERARGA